MEEKKGLTPDQEERLRAKQEADDKLERKDDIVKLTVGVIIAGGIILLLAAGLTFRDITKSIVGKK
jgi:hypothetical protein